jgi:hypothetical protein
MPSLLINNASGGQLVISGAQYSGRLVPTGGVQLRLDPLASGAAYIGLSGGMTVRSGGLLDGMVLNPGDGHFVPKIGYGFSGNPQIRVLADAAVSGQGLLFWEIY